MQQILLRKIKKCKPMLFGWSINYAFEQTSIRTNIIRTIHQFEQHNSNKFEQTSIQTNIIRTFEQTSFEQA